MTDHYPVIVVGFSGVLLLDIAGPVQVFATANRLLPSPYYEVGIYGVSPNGFETDTGLEIRSSGTLADAPTGGDLIVPGYVEPMCTAPDDRVFTERLRGAISGRNRVISICSGSLLLAATGLLKGRSATSHWDQFPMAMKKFPEVNWKPNAIYVEDGDIFTSAGVTTGIDLALLLVERDHGSKLALEVARKMVVQLRRPGGQSQYSPLLTLQYGLTAALTRVCEAVHMAPEKDWRVSKLADIAGMTERNVTRRFKSEIGISPAKFVEKVRLDLARTLLETSELSVKEIAVKTGFMDAQKLRRAFIGAFGMTTSHYQRGPSTVHVA